MNVVLNKSSQEPLSQIFRESFACFRGPIGVAFSKIENSYKDITSLLWSRYYLVFRGSFANLAPMLTFLERYLSRMSGKSMPVDLDHVKSFMGFSTAFI